LHFLPPSMTVTPVIFFAHPDALCPECLQQKGEAPPHHGTIPCSSHCARDHNNQLVLSLHCRISYHRPTVIVIGLKRPLDYYYGYFSCNCCVIYSPR
jgi:hypothetical protein